MTDRELLEKAAKAAGLNEHRYCEAWKAMALYTMQDGYNGPSWNPLTDDGDALRLAVRLDMQIWRNTGGSVSAMPPSAGFWQRDQIDLAPDPYAATRRAIVRAAAAIGEQLK